MNMTQQEYAKFVELQSLFASKQDAYDSYIEERDTIREDSSLSEEDQEAQIDQLDSTFNIDELEQILNNLLDLIEKDSIREMRIKIEKTDMFGNSLLHEAYSTFLSNIHNRQAFCNKY